MHLSFKVLSLITFFTLAININAESIYNFKVPDYEGNEVSLEKYSGKVTLIVNVASFCGYTEAMYRAMTRIHDILSHDGYFSVLAFPCNQFGEQEPNDAPLIFASMQEQFFVEFPLFDKIDVKGSNASPLFKELIEQSSVVPDWNFYKYLVDHNGEVLNAWSTTTTMEDIFDEVEAAIQEAKNASESDGKTKEPLTVGKVAEDAAKEEL